MGEKIVVYDAPSGGVPLSLAAPIGTGGEGAVYIAPRPGDGKEIAVKVFNDRKLGESRDFLSRKITAMVEMGKANGKALVRHPMLAWPQLPVYDQNGRWVGYAMKRAQGKPLILANPMSYHEHFPGMNREKTVLMLAKLLNAAKVLHNHEVFIGDVNPSNVLWDGEGDPCWIDIDSFQVAAPNGERFPCPVGRPEMTPPEHLGQSRNYGNINYAAIVRTRESDLFSLAILVFQCLMLGRYPYDHIGGGSPVENLRKGRFPYVQGGAVPGTHGGIPKGPWHKIWTHYTYKLKQLFVRTFVDGALAPSKRPSADEWVKELRGYVRILNLPDSAPRVGGAPEFRHSRDMIPAEEKPKDVGRREFPVRKGRWKSAARTSRRKSAARP